MKQRYTVNTQAVVGSNLIFLDVATGFPGSIHDGRMLEATKQYQDAEANMILSKSTDVIENNKSCPLLISDGAYQAISWQLKPYSFTIRLNGKIQQEIIFCTGDSGKSYWTSKRAMEMPSETCR